MAMTKSEVRRAFRAAMAADYAHVPAADDVEHRFSPAFLEKMAALLAKERRGSWQLLSRQRRRALVVAAILAAALLLTACSPTLREAVAELLVTFHERFVEYGATAGPHEKIETVYVLDPVPEGFELVSQEQQSEAFIKTVYRNPQNQQMTLRQFLSPDPFSSMDAEHGTVLLLEADGFEVLAYLSESLSHLTWTYDGYYMRLSYFGELSADQALSLATSLAPME